MEHLIAAAIDDEESWELATSSASASAASPTNHAESRLNSSSDNEDEESVFDNNGFKAPPQDRATRGGIGITWQAMFQQLKDFHDLGHHKVPPRLANWANAQRRQYKMYGIGIKQPTGIITNRIRQLDSIAFDWNATFHNEEDGRANGHDSYGEDGEPYTKSPVHPRVVLPPNYNPNAKRGFGPGMSSRSSSFAAAAGSTTSSKSKSSKKTHHVSTSSTRGGKQNWTTYEDELLFSLQSQWGNKWKAISREMPGRSDNDIKHRFNSLKRMHERRLESSPMDVDSDYEDGGGGDDGSFQDRTGHVQSMVRAALERDRQKESRRGKRYSSRVASTEAAGASVSSTVVTTTGTRTRKPSRRSQESYNPLGGDDDTSSMGSSVNFAGLQRLESALSESSKKKKAFGELLFAMVNDCSKQTPHILDWTSDGTAFKFYDFNLLPSIIGRYFRHNNYKSLQRIMYMYGFKKENKTEHLYRHAHFTRWSTREDLIMYVVKEDTAAAQKQMPASSTSRGRKPPTSRTAPSSSKQVVPVSKSKKSVKHAKPSKGVPAHALLSSKPPSSTKSPGHESKGVGVSHPKLLFPQATKMAEQPPPPRETTVESKDNSDGKTSKKVEKEVDQKKPPAPKPNPTQPTSHDIILSLNSPLYKEVMFAKFKALGPKKNNGKTEDADVMKDAANDAMASLQTKMKDDQGKIEGRLLKNVKGDDGHTWNEVVDESWALQKISNDLRQRMEYEKLWLTDEVGADGKVTSRPIDTNLKMEDVEQDPMPSYSDLIISLKTPKYREVMFAQFKKMGEKSPEISDDVQKLKSIAREILGLLKKDMVDNNGNRGRFFRKARGSNHGEAPYELLDEDTAVSRFVQDLRRRNESQNDWLHFALEKPQRNESEANATKSEAKKDRDHKPEATSDFPQWNLGPYSETAGVKYFPSEDIGEMWVVQHVPRKKYLSTGSGPKVDRYFLDPNGNRFRSRTEAWRFLEQGDEETDDDASGTSKGDIQPCTCKKSKCLKLYCECFNKEKYCSAGCSCNDCHNKPEYNELRNKVISQVKEKNPEAFEPSAETTTCTCTRTACLKKYCECFARGLYCGYDCSCRDCENIDPDKQREEEDEEVTGEPVEQNHDWHNDRKIKLFPECLHDLVSLVNKEDPSLMRWTSKGDSFVVHDMSDTGTKDRIGTYIEQFFRHNNYASLLKQLRNYGFTETTSVSDASCSFHHPSFRQSMKRHEFDSVVRLGAAPKKQAKKTSKKRSAEVSADKRPHKKAKTSSVAPKSASKKDEGKTLTCPTCHQDFYYRFAGTAAASFSKHTKSCKQAAEEDAAAETSPSKSSTSPSKTSTNKKSLKSPSPEKVKSSSSASKPKVSDEPVSFTCPKCSRDFVYGNKGTAKASFTNHVRRCDPSKPLKEKPTKARTVSKKFTSPAKGSRSLPSRSSKSPEAVLSSTPSQEEKKPAAKKSPEKTSPEKPITELAAVASSNEKEPSTPKPSSKKKYSSAELHDNDLVLSLKNPRYKEVLFARFRELGPRKGSDENPLLDGLKQELLDQLRRGMGGDGKFFKSDRQMTKFFEVDDEEAKFKILCDLRRRNENMKVWNEK